MTQKFRSRITTCTDQTGVIDPGGACIYVHSSLTSKLVAKFDNTYVESLCVTIKELNTVIGGVYRPPETPSEMWREAAVNLDKNMV